MDKNAGQKIKDLRTKKKLTLKELSELTNLSVSYLSLIERGRASINLTTLEAISSGLDVSPAFFFDVPEQRESHVTRCYEQPVYRMGGNHIYFGLSGIAKHENTIFEPLIALLLPGETREDIEPYAHEGEEFYYVLEGRLTFIIGATEYELYPGDSLHIQSNQPHNWGNFTNNIVRVLCVITPKVFVHSNPVNFTP
jgi:transcriptional regulator with XRE-family HTH domain